MTTTKTPTPIAMRGFCHFGGGGGSGGAGSDFACSSTCADGEVVGASAVIGHRRCAQPILFEQHWSDGSEAAPTARDMRLYSYDSELSSPAGKLPLTLQRPESAYHAAKPDVGGRGVLRLR